MYTEADEKGGDIKNSGSVDDVSLSSASDIDKDEVYSFKEQRAIIHRIDRRLVIACGVIYCFSLIDRGNLGNASIAGWVIQNTRRESTSTHRPFSLA